VLLKASLRYFHPALKASSCSIILFPKVPDSSTNMSLYDNTSVDYYHFQDDKRCTRYSYSNGDHRGCIYHCHH
jgi:hypothetical protein